jgi:membrane protein DedA with SNARE-associated domain
MLALIGQSVGDNWEDWRHRLGYLDYVVLAAIVGGAIYLLVKRRRKGGADEDDSTPAADPVRSSSA